MRFDLSDHPGLVLAICVMLFVVGIGVLISAVNRAGFPVEVAEIEQVRAGVQAVDPSEAEDVIGQAVEMNRKIVAMQHYNKMLVIDWMIPDGWNSVQLIGLKP